MRFKHGAVYDLDNPRRGRRRAVPVHGAAAWLAQTFQVVFITLSTLNVRSDVFPVRSRCRRQREFRCSALCRSF